MRWPYRATFLTAAATLAIAAALAPAGAATHAAKLAKPARSAAAGSQHTLYRIKILGKRSNGQPRLAVATPNGLPPSAIKSVYNLSGLSPSSGAGAGQIIAIVDAYHDPNALSDLNKFNTQYGYATLATCTSLSQSGSCFEQVHPGSHTPSTNSGWALEESLDIEWAHAEAPAAKIVLVEATSATNANLFSAVSYANSLGASEVSMSWGGSESSGETSFDSYFMHAGTLYTVSAGDSGHGAESPASSPNVVAVGGTTLNGCSGTTCSGSVTETTWTGSGGGASAYESVPAYQAGYTGTVFGASTISALTGAKRGIPDVSFVANPNTGVSVYDSTSYQGQSGWWTLGGTSVGAPNWAGILAAGAAAGDTALQGNSRIYSGGYQANLRDVTSGTNGSCGTDCTAGAGYDLVTGLGSPVNYP